MQPDTPPTNNDAAAQPGLPPVKPPSGRFILQLFLIPGLIVAGLVLVFALGGLALFGPSSPESFLKRLDSDNADIRWRAAHELAQVLKRPESLELASDVHFALDLAERLDAAMTELENQETSIKAALKKKFAEIDADKNLTQQQKNERGEQEALAAWRKLSPQRNLILYLTSCLGDFVVPVGAPILCKIALTDQGAEEKGLTLKRRRAVWALANLGDKLQRHWFGKTAKPGDKVLTADQKAAILAKLEKEANGHKPERVKMARYTLGVLQGKIPTGVDIALENCVRGNRRIKRCEDTYLRELVAFALNFWDGERVEPTLLYLSLDNGYGKRIEVTESD